MIKRATVATLALLSLASTTSAQAIAAAAPALPPDPTGSPAERAQSALGLVLLIVLTAVIGRLRNGRWNIPWRTVIWGVGLMAAFAGIVLYSPSLLQVVNNVINALLENTKAGARMVFGNLYEYAVPAEITAPDGSTLKGVATTGGVVAFYVLPTIVFFSALTAVAYHIGIMQWIVRAIAWVMSKSMRTSGAETLSSASNIFVGQTEAPLMVKPFMRAATNSELMAIMVAGFANIASGVLGIYTQMLQSFVRDAGGHLAAACFISAPAGLLVAKLLVPETETPVSSTGVSTRIEKLDENLIDAASRGTSEGLTLALNVGAMLIAFTALVALLNGLVGWTSLKLGLTVGGSPLTIEMILGWIFAPLAWLVGIPWAECPRVGSLLGVKTVLNEYIAYANMQAGFTADPAYLSPRSALLATYALCGFANFASIGIQVGGIASIVPERRKDLAKLGLLAMAGGGIATLMAAAMVGIIK